LSTSEQGTANSEQRTGKSEQGTAKREQGRGNREEGTAKREQRKGMANRAQEGTAGRRRENKLLSPVRCSLFAVRCSLSAVPRTKETDDEIHADAE
jgi:hypothetical protein